MAMEEHLINSAIGNKLCRVKPIRKDFYRVTLDGVFAGFMRRDGSGWMLEEYSREELTAENVQLIGDKIDGLPWQFKQ
jgi:hypothetical protein